MGKEEALKNLQTLIENIKELQQLNYQSTHPELDKFVTRAQRYLTNIFGKDHNYLSTFKSIHYYDYVASISCLFNNTSPSYNENNQAYHKDLIKVQTLIESAIEEIEEWKNGVDENITLTQIAKVNTSNKVSNHIAENTTPTQIPQANTSNKVFIVHGHDELAISQVSELLRKLNLEPIVLRDQVSRSDTVIEKIENYTSKVGFGVILYTECDIGGKTIDSLQSRARQNVVLEHGYLMAKLGRENTMALVKGSVETPGDISGLVYTLMDEHKAWQYKLVDELRASGYNASKDNI